MRYGAVECTIDGVTSTAYRYGGQTYGTPGRVARKSNNKYRFVYDMDFTVVQDHYLYVTTDGTISGATIVYGSSYYTGSSAYYKASDEAILHNNSVSFDMTITGCTYINVLHGSSFFIDSTGDSSVSFNGVEESDYTTAFRWEIYDPTPTITTAPSITSVNPASGQSTTVSWSAASVSNQGTAVIRYQYGIGTGTTYQTSYLLRETTSRSATITEEDILSKCGSDFSGTCYIFVRAYWDTGSTQGGHTTPSRASFTYEP